MADFRGILPAIITPMNTQGQLDEEAFRQVIEYNIQAGVHGFWVGGGTGESIHLDDAENNRLAEIAADQARGRIANIMHVGAPSTARAVKMAEHAARAGVDAICCVPPFFYPPSDEEVVEHYRAVAAATDLPFFVYNLPQCTGVEITPVLMKKIQDKVPQLTGLKHSAITFGDTREYVKMGLVCLIGNSTLMLPAMTVGAAGCIDGPPNAAPELWVEIWKAYQAGDLKRAEAAQDKATEITLMIREFGFHAATKFVLSERLGIECGDPRAPLLPLTEQQREQIRQRMVELELGPVSVS